MAERIFIILFACGQQRRSKYGCGTVAGHVGFRGCDCVPHSDYEVIFQIGNKDDMSAASENGDLARAVLDKFMRSFQERNPHIHVFSAHLHMEEATPHLHIDFIPYTIGSKRVFPLVYL